MTNIKKLLLLLIPLGFATATLPTNKVPRTSTDTVTNEVITLTDSNFVTIRGEIDGSLASKVITELMEVKDKTIHLYLVTPGGSIVDGMKIIQTMKALEKSGKKIICLADVALSMGFVILQYCPERVIMQSSVVMQHQSSLQIKGPLNNVNSYVTFVHSISNEVDDQQSQRLVLSIDDFRNKVNNDWWLFGSDILKNNVADKMLSVVCDFDTTIVETKIYTIFGPIILHYSKCPLASEPLKIQFDDDFPAEKQAEIVQSLSISNMLEEKLKNYRLV